MRLTIKHTTTYSYDPPAGRVMLRLRLWPNTFDSQKIVKWSVSVNGTVIAPQFNNGFGEGEAVWRSPEQTGEVAIVAEGEVDTIDTAGVLRGLQTSAPAGVYVRNSHLTRPNDAIRDLAESLEGADNLTKLHMLKDIIPDHVRYQTGVTAEGTTAAEAMALGAGVCQDHAHVFIACARTLGIPARYVSGYMLADEDDRDRHATHGWVEAHIAGLGWVGFDPSNSVCPTDRYVRLTSGIDARDATPIRGNVYAGGAESLMVAVAINTIAGQSQQQ